MKKQEAARQLKIMKTVTLLLCCHC